MAQVEAVKAVLVNDGVNHIGLAGVTGIRKENMGADEIDTAMMMRSQGHHLYLRPITTLMYT